MTDSRREWLDAARAKAPDREAKLGNPQAVLFSAIASLNISLDWIEELELADAGEIIQYVITDLEDLTGPYRRAPGENGDGLLTTRQRAEISKRTRAGLDKARARGQKLGRPSGVPAEVRQRIRRERPYLSLADIAAGLNADGIPTSQGGAAWYASTVRFVLSLDEAAE